MIKKPKVSVITSLYRCEKYLNGFFKYVANLNYTDDIEILLLHNDPQKEETEIIEQATKGLAFVKYIPVPERESLYKTWNRGINLAIGKYICIWNVDDIRLPDSIYRQMTTLDNNSDAVMTYGDFYYMYEYDKPSEDMVISPNFEERRHCFYENHHIGCFPMWKKDLHDTVGYFDEQLRLVGDFDFQIRVAFNHKLIKTPDTILGFYLENDPSKLSSNYILQHKERNLIYLRYGNYRYLNWAFIPHTFKYKRSRIIYNGLNHKLKRPAFFRIKRIHLSLLSIINQPRNIAAYIKHGIFKL